MDRSSSAAESSACISWPTLTAWRVTCPHPLPLDLAAVPLNFRRSSSATECSAEAVPSDSSGRQTGEEGEGERRDSRGRLLIGRGGGVSIVGTTGITDVPEDVPALGSPQARRLSASRSCDSSAAVTILLA